MSGGKEIKLFLNDLKKVDEINFVNTYKNQRTARSMGLTTFEREDIIRNLNHSNYFSGPHDDDDMRRTGKIWIFKANYDGHTLYIKLKDKIEIDGKTIIICLSCHIDEK